MYLYRKRASIYALYRNAGQASFRNVTWVCIEIARFRNVFDAHVVAP